MKSELGSDILADSLYHLPWGFKRLRIVDPYEDKTDAGRQPSERIDSESTEQDHNANGQEGGTSIYPAPANVDRYPWPLLWFKDNEIEGQYLLFTSSDRSKKILFTLVVFTLTTFVQGYIVRTPPDWILPMLWLVLGIDVIILLMGLGALKLRHPRFRPSRIGRIKIMELLCTLMVSLNLVFLAIEIFPVIQRCQDGFRSQFVRSSPDSGNSPQCAEVAVTGTAMWLVFPPITRFFSVFVPLMLFLITKVIARGAFSAQLPAEQDFERWILVVVVVLWGMTLSTTNELRSRRRFVQWLELWRLRKPFRERKGHVDGFLSLFVTESEVQNLISMQPSVQNRTATVAVCQFVDYCQWLEQRPPVPIICALDTLFCCFENTARGLQTIDYTNILGDSFVAASTLLPNHRRDVIIMRMLYFCFEQHRLGRWLRQTQNVATPLVVGVSTGYFTSATVGELQVCFSCCGEALNAAFRLAKCTGYGYCTVLDEATIQLAGPALLVRSCGTLYAAGTNDILPSNVFVVDDRTFQTEEAMNLLGVQDFFTPAATAANEAHRGVSNGSSVAQVIAQNEPTFTNMAQLPQVGSSSASDHSHSDPAASPENQDDIFDHPTIDDHNPIQTKWRDAFIEKYLPQLKSSVEGFARAQELRESMLTYQNSFCTLSFPAKKVESEYAEHARFSGQQKALENLACSLILCCIPAFRIDATETVNWFHEPENTEVRGMIRFISVVLMFCLCLGSIMFQVRSPFNALSNALSSSIVVACSVLALGALVPVAQRYRGVSTDVAQLFLLQIGETITIRAWYIIVLIQFSYLALAIGMTLAIDQDGLTVPGTSSRYLGYIPLTFIHCLSALVRTHTIELSRRKQFLHLKLSAVLGEETRREMMIHETILARILPSATIEKVALRLDRITNTPIYFHLHDSALLHADVHIRGEFSDAGRLVELNTALNTALQRSLHCRLIRTWGDRLVIGGSLQLVGNRANPHSPTTAASPPNAEDPFVEEHIKLKNAERTTVDQCSEELLMILSALIQFKNASITAIFVRAESYAAVLGVFRPHFDFIGTATRLGAALLDEAPIGYMGCTEQFRLGVNLPQLHFRKDNRSEESGRRSPMELDPSQEGLNIVLGVPSSWRLRFNGVVRMYPLHRAPTLGD
jgi:hypothetical protein